MSRYHDRVAQGLCGMCGAVSPQGPLCPTCKELSRQRAAAKRERNAAAGLCRNCKTPIESGTYCDKCKLARKQARQRKTARRKQQGICVECGDKAKDGCTMCQSCIDKRTKVSSEHYHRRKAAGCCSLCKQPPVPGKTLCQNHLEKTQEYRDAVRLEVLMAYGGLKCAHCDETDFHVLELDHINGGGGREATLTGRRGHGLYLWLREHGFPPGFRVLCRVCNNKAHVDRCKAAGRRLTTPYEPEDLAPTEEPQP